MFLAMRPLAESGGVGSSPGLPSVWSSGDQLQARHHVSEPGSVRLRRSPSRGCRTLQSDAGGSDSSEPQPAETDARPERELQARVLEAHQRLLDGDPVASADLYELLLDPLVRALRRRGPDASWAEAVEDAAVDALVQHIRAAERYDPARASLLGWLVWQANADLINVYRSAQRQFERNVEIASQLRNEDEARFLDTVGGASDRYLVLENTGMWERIQTA